MFLISYNRLSEEQKEVVKRISREKKNLFVEGPPGSGKTLISLYTLRDMVQEGTVRPLLLMYNHSLYGYLQTAMKELEIADNITIATKDKFFWDLAREFNIESGYGSYNEKYDNLLTGLQSIPLSKIYDVAVVDEVQDLNPKEWELINKLTKRITSLGDFNQGIYESDLSKDDITKSSLLERLTKIFRFHKNIAKFASLFSRTNDDLESKVIKLSQTTPQFIESNKDDEFDKIIEILTSIKSLRQRIGIICPDRDLLDSLSDFLGSKDVEYDYYPENRDLRTHDFTSTTPLLISSFSAKGLEFEHVILFGFNASSGMVTRLRNQNRLRDVLYVSITRTNANLYIIKTEDTIDELKNVDLFKTPVPAVDPSDWF
ncbi:MULTISPECIES: UvrD-helicase domain-containing protein [Sphingobacterium]|uniref:UvrD-helicase domain-containing protein n=1 Tax=Sphingobacterium TaxID=28453 RepID=UPI0013DBC3D7|nr:MULTISPECIES: UvrD-helicase domain-containing protein [unclassified Sphingobacterium]